MTLGCQDLQHRAGVPLGPTASNTEVLCWSVYTGSIQAQQAPTAVLAQLPLATELGVLMGRRSSTDASPFLLVCSPVVAVCEVWGKAGREGTPWCCRCLWWCSYSRVLRVHGLSLPPWAQRTWSLSPASRENRSLPHAWNFGNPMSSFSTCHGETEGERCSRETGGNGNKKMLERNWKEKT